MHQKTVPGHQPDTVKIYRIIHIDNIEYLLKNGMYHSEHIEADPHYINIGDGDLIAKRHEYPVGINPPGGALGEYIPFYFGPLSPMLLNIKTGYSGVKQRPQKDIVYIVCKLDDITAICGNWCFTDGHAKKRISAFYNNLDDLSEVSWDIVAERYWRDTEDDFDRMRKKQAEFLVKNHVPVNCILGIVTYNNETAKIVKETLNKLNLDIPIRINPNEAYYY
ncbi:MULTISPECIES: DUF4433 domain-containing protein [unclassified Mucilaginibacter]|uniref:type II toxin-antitoxin system toxin DNA ADP-ribosyl transferase DarT n=1 Tax=unclassified Mucilaginibacter TaxID=2617802 RepID=UPI002AC8E6CF|nr:MULTISPECIES: DUF4433 domain-containing protein [unclassified Mucilaginibacter]MEB0261660.1 DUF4433 domain-containing protein [Mucilaginibacter sp. 10I4]MEB0278525.1 DUF4433 domain-containing protein [Mucilaginibacter sp. 10B2]MEB0300745.1 DUF4433 domain-containing protein [Mucilaginibacter sp. 5C4]WPX23519.1 DUF4433 domain-containing protein [Mucilaginibacter sp. 5C4]